MVVMGLMRYLRYAFEFGKHERNLIAFIVKVMRECNADGIRDGKNLFAVLPDWPAGYAAQLCDKRLKRNAGPETE